MSAHQKTKVAFVVVGWNNADLLLECFESIKNQDYSESLTVYVDNDSNDDSAHFVRKHYPEAIIIEPGRNTGFAKGNNLGIARAFQDESVGHVALVNSDARIATDWTTRIVAFAAQKPRGAFFQGTTLDYYDHQIIDSTHLYISHNGQGTQGNWRHYYIREGGPKKVFGVNAAACLITRNFIEAQPFGNEFFDETMYMYLEDVDVAARATIMGWDNYLVPGARAYHMGSASSGKNPGFSLYMTFRNNSALLFKNYSFRLLIRMFPKIVRGDFDTLRSLWRNDKKESIKYVLKGRLVGCFRLVFFLKKRRTMARVRAVHENYLWQLMRRGV